MTVRDVLLLAGLYSVHVVILVPEARLPLLLPPWLFVTVTETVVVAVGLLEPLSDDVYHSPVARLLVLGPPVGCNWVGDFLS